MGEDAMKRLLFLLAVAAAALGHDIITTPITFDREIARIIYTHCAQCHHEGGAASPLDDSTRKLARGPSRSRKSWPAACLPWEPKGFGDFRNDPPSRPELNRFRSC